MTETTKTNLPVIGGYRHILKNRVFLYLTEFFSGMAVMAVELGASRLMAPYFSSSQIVWTIIIGTIMIAMALGNIYGGRRADANPDPDSLYRRVLVAAIWIAAIPFVGRFVILGVSALLIFTVSNGFLIVAAFVSCMIIFVYPLFLLGTVTPSLVKYTTDSLEDNGRIVGTLGACNTIGSIIGTFMPTFVTIPAVGTSMTFLLFSGILLVLGILYFCSRRDGGDNVSADGVDANTSVPVNSPVTKHAGVIEVDKNTVSSDSEKMYDSSHSSSLGSRKHCKPLADRPRVIIAIALYLVCAILDQHAGFAFWEHDLAVEDESIYNYLQVKETKDEVILSTNVLFGVQSIYEKNQNLTGMYYDYALAAPLMAGAAQKEASGKPLRVLVLGNGSGTYATMCERYFPGAQIEGVEIDQKITNLAHQYFSMPKDVKVATYDGRAYLEAVKQKYDVIMVDAYQDITIPFQMSSTEFFTLVKDHLTENGVMVVNMNMRNNAPGSINDYLSDTIASVFSHVYTADVENNTNRELFATNQDGSILTMDDGIRETKDTALKDMMYQVSGDMTAYHGGNKILTDDKAPVELLGMRAIDSLIEDEVGYYKDIYKTEGLQGLLKEL